ncbi:MAG TPA: hypothetical protein VKY24_00820 [Reyranella sp.]|nr:hypothetical protein [Reyranella sp.]
MFDNQTLTGRILRANPVGVLVEIGETRWWVERNRSGDVGR